MGEQGGGAASEASDLTDGGLVAEGAVVDRHDEFKLLGHGGERVSKNQNSNRWVWVAILIGVGYVLAKVSFDIV